MSNRSWNVTLSVIFSVLGIISFVLATAQGEETYQAFLFLLMSGQYRILAAVEGK